MDTTRNQFKTIDEYVETFPEEVQGVLEKMRQTIRKAAPEAEEAISYQIPTFKLNGNLVHFAAFKNHISFFPTAQGSRSIQERTLTICRIKRDGSISPSRTDPI